jgi:hypothetical protein
MKQLIWGIPEAEYFSRQIWTTQITLRLLGKFRFWRRACAPLRGLRRKVYGAVLAA